MPKSRQARFLEMMSGVLVYAVVLGFFNDYTEMLHTGTYSVTFALAIVMQLLTYLTFRVKDRVVRLTKRHQARHTVVVRAVSIWIILFISKFVFLWVITIVFRGEVQVSGFVGLILIILTTTIATQILARVYSYLGVRDHQDNH